MEKKKTLENFDDLLSEIVTDGVLEEVPMSKIDELNILIREEPYQIAINYREGFNFDEFKRLYQDYFEKYDYIVGDWAHEKLRLRGFYQVNFRKSSKDRVIDFLDDYLKEYCNFGCAYFVIGKKQAIEAYPTMLEKYQENLLRQEKKDPSKVSVRDRGTSPAKRKRSRQGNKFREDSQQKNQSKPKFVQKDKQQKSKNSKSTDYPKNSGVKNQAKSSNRKNKGSFVIKQKGSSNE